MGNSAEATFEVDLDDRFAGTVNGAEVRRPRHHARLTSWHTVAQRRDSLYRRLLAGADGIAVVLALFAGVVAVGGDALTPAAVLLPVALIVAVKAAGLYERDEHLIHKTTLEEVPALFAISAISALVFWICADAFVEGVVGQRAVVTVWIMLFVSLVMLRRLVRTVAREATPPERCLLVGESRTAEYVREKLSLSPNVSAQLIGRLRPGDHDDLERGEKLVRELEPLLASQSIDRVILAMDSEGRDDLLFLIGELKAHGVKVSVLPEASSVAGSSVELDDLHGMTLLGMRRFEITRSSRIVKRSFDVAVSALLLVLLSPVLLATAVAIRLDTPGPILFRQRRIGLRGRPFVVLKFRSMVSEAEQLKEELQHLNEGAAGLFKIREDPRVTRVGRFIRRLQIDELPQLYNVLRGDMSLVGPRPLIPEEDRRIEGRYRRRLEIRPGITGHWQILGSSRAIPLTEMVKLDYLYLANWSLWSDIRLLLRTVPFVLARRGM